MSRLQATLAAFVEREQTAGTPLVVDLPIGKFGVYEGLHQTDYALEAVDYPLCRRLTFRCRLQSPNVARFQVPHAGLDMRFLSDLREQGVKVLNSRLVGLNTPSQRAMFEIAGDIPVQLVFVASAHTGQIDLWVNNFLELGGRRYVIEPDSLTPEYLRQLEDLLLRKHTGFLDQAHFVGESENYNQLQFRLANSSLASAGEAVGAKILSFEVNPLSLSRRIVLTFRSHRSVVDAQNTICRMGRRSPADIHVRSRFVSRDHSSLVFEHNEFILRDHSSNGTFVKPEGQHMVFVHQGTFKLTGRGFISLGEEISPENANVIFYEVD